MEHFERKEEHKRIKQVIHYIHIRIIASWNSRERWEVMMGCTCQRFFRVILYIVCANLLSIYHIDVNMDLYFVDILCNNQFFFWNSFAVMSSWHIHLFEFDHDKRRYLLFSCSTFQSQPDVIIKSQGDEIHQTTTRLFKQSLKER
jgi:hypothetical protein